MIVSNDPSIIAGQIANQDFVQTIQKYMALHKDTSQFKEGEKVTFDNGIMVIPIRANGSNKQNIPLEAHRKFFDIHYTLEGNDTVAYKPVADCNNVLEEYKEEGDYILYNEKPDQSIAVASGYFCIIPNLYAHAALYEDKGQITKVVFKVPVL